MVTLVPSGQTQGLELEQALGAGGFATGDHSDLALEFFGFFHELSCRTVVQAVFSSNNNRLLAHGFTPLLILFGEMVANEASCLTVSVWIYVVK